MDIPRLDVEYVTRFCFACGQENPIGLRLIPVHDGDEVTADFTPGQFHQGWNDATHGGILYTLLDELAFYAILCNGVDFAVTGKSEVKFKKVAAINEPIRASGRVTKLTRRLVEVRALLTLHDGTVIAEGDFLYYVMRRSSRAVLWDMDGVIADTAALHFAAWQETFARRGIGFADEDFAGLFGARNDFIIKTVMDERLSAEDISAIARDKEEVFRTKASGKISLCPGAVRLLDAVRKGGFKQGLISSAPRENIELVVGELGLEGLFDCILSGKDVSESKPSPQICLRAAERLGLTPEDCLVIEDSPLGIKAARAAGMRCLAVATTRSRQELGEADRVVDSLDDVDLITLLIRV